MKRWLVAVIFILSVTGCATQANYESRLDLWKGASEKKLIDAWGIPQGSYVSNDGVKYLIYSYVRNTSTPTMLPNLLLPFGLPGRTSQESCQTTFIVKDERVIGWKIQGNDCTSPQSAQQMQEHEFSSTRNLAMIGDVNAQLHLADLYANGLGVAKNETKAFEWAQKAATKGNADAQLYLAHMYSAGGGVAKDEAKAFEWMLKSAMAGNVEAQNNSGMWYLKGIGTQKDLAKALKWFEIAALAGEPSAQTTIGWAYMSDDFGLARDYLLALDWNMKASKQGFGEGTSNIGLLYENGWGVPVNYVEAANWHKKAIEQKAHSGQAEFQLGGLYEKGLGVPKDLGESARLYRTVIEKFSDCECVGEAQKRLNALMSAR